jgi:hypothetical protein
VSDQDKALKSRGEEENTQDASPAPKGEIEVPEASEEVSEPKAEPAGEPEGKEAKTGEGSKKGKNQRIRQLVKEKNEAKAKAKSLADRVAELTAPVEPQAVQQPTPPQPDEPIVKPGEEIDAVELDKRLRDREAKILQRADAIATLRGKQFDAMTRINNEASATLKTYPELDPDSESFDKELSSSVTEAVEAHVRANPYQASVKKFVAKLMKPYKRAVAKESAKVTENVARQASETALRPTQVKGGDKKFEELTTAEMEEKLGVVY